MLARRAASRLARGLAGRGATPTTVKLSAQIRCVSQLNLGNPIMPPASVGSALPMRMNIGQVRTMFIQTEPTPNPQSLKFCPGRIVLEEQFGAGLDMTPKSPEAKRSPLARRLFAINGIVRVFYGRDFISITKSESESWEDLKTLIFATIMDYYAEGAPIVTEPSPPSDTDVLDDDDEVVAMIKELLDAKIRPAVQDDGGDIYFRGFDPATGIVKLKLAGSCAGCPSSVVTLKNGVENMLMHYIPEVNGIEEVEDEYSEVGMKEFKSLEEKLRAAGVPSI